MLSRAISAITIEALLFAQLRKYRVPNANRVYYTQSSQNFEMSLQNNAGPTI